MRNDRLGDFMLAWPALQMIAQNLPQAELTLLARDYTAPLAHLCRGVAEVICDPAVEGDFANARALARLLRPTRFDAAVALFSRFDTALGLVLARIPLRAAPATKLAQIFYTHRLRQHRSRSEKPEYVYNLELAAHFLGALGVADPVWPQVPYLAFPDDEVFAVKQRLAMRLGFDPSRALVFLHPGHGGSSAMPSPRLFARIGRALEADGAELVISAGPADGPAASALARELGDVPHAIYRSDSGLADYARHVAATDLFVSGSTGPLHIAGALDRPTAAFYPRRRSATALRWQAMNGEDRRLAFMPPSGAEENDYDAINFPAAIERIRALLREGPHRASAPTDLHI
ncbi:MAG: glycosyltransferase family 9 protein [Gammaproteobacteria bacterium]